jgi:hypothetical protein
MLLYHVFKRMVECYLICFTKLARSSVKNLWRMLPFKSLNLCAEAGRNTYTVRSKWSLCAQFPLSCSPIPVTMKWLQLRGSHRTIRVIVYRLRCWGSNLWLGMVPQQFGWLNRLLYRICVHVYISCSGSLFIAIRQLNRDSIQPLIVLYPVGNWY